MALAKFGMRPKHDALRQAVRQSVDVAINAYAKALAEYRDGMRELSARMLDDHVRRQIEGTEWQRNANERR